MRFERGHKKVGGRTRGTPNRLTADVREAILGAFADVGGREYLARVARENPPAFLALLGRVIPREIRAQLGEPIVAHLDYSRSAPKPHASTHRKFRARQAE